MTPLTDRQTEILGFIREFINANKYPPSIKEIADAFGITIKGAWDHCNAIERKGYIRHTPGISRSITITEDAQ